MTTTIEQYIREQHAAAAQREQQHLDNLLDKIQSMLSEHDWVSCVSVERCGNNRFAELYEATLVVNTEDKTHNAYILSFTVDGEDFVMHQSSTVMDTETLVKQVVLEYYKAVHPGCLPPGSRR